MAKKKAETPERKTAVIRPPQEEEIRPETSADSETEESDGANTDNVEEDVEPIGGLNQDGSITYFDTDGDSDVEPTAIPGAKSKPKDARRFFRVRAEGLRGTYLDALFDDNCVCEKISQATLDSLQDDMPGLMIEYLG